MATVGRRQRIRWQICLMWRSMVFVVRSSRLRIYRLILSLSLSILDRWRTHRYWLGMGRAHFTFKKELYWTSLYQTIQMRCISSLWGVKPSCWDQFLRIMGYSKRRHMIGICFGQVKAISLTSMITWMSTRKSITFLRASSSLAKTDFVLTLSKCKRDLERKHSTSFLTLIFYRMNSLTSTAIFTSSVNSKTTLLKKKNWISGS